MSQYALVESAFLLNLDKVMKEYPMNSIHSRKGIFQESSSVPVVGVNPLPHSEHLYRCISLFPFHVLLGEG